jgi:hypothetical protein
MADDDGVASWVVEEAGWVGPEGMTMVMMVVAGGVERKMTTFVAGALVSLRSITCVVGCGDMWVQWQPAGARELREEKKDIGVLRLKMVERRWLLVRWLKKLTEED